MKKIIKEIKNEKDINDNYKTSKKILDLQMLVKRESSLKLLCKYKSI